MMSLLLIFSFVSIIVCALAVFVRLDAISRAKRRADIVEAYALLAEINTYDRMIERRLSNDE